MEKQLKEYQREYQDVQEIKNLENRKEELKQQMTWALVQEAENVFWYFVTTNCY
jgi:chromosome segregation ATPase